MSSLPPFPSFDITDQVSLGPSWEKWLNRFENFLIALNVNNDARKKALLLHYAGEAVYDIYDTLQADDDDYPAVRHKLSVHFKPVKLTQFRVYTFRKTEQLPNETLDGFAIRLRTLAKDCEFTNVDTEILSQITQKCRSSKVRRRSFQEGITLKELIDYGRALETAEQEASSIEAAADTPVNKVYAKKYTKQTHVNHKTTTPSGATCGHCGGSYPHQGQCPAYGLQCHSCNKANHFARCCRAKTRNNPPSQQYRKVTNKFNQNGRQQSNQKQKVNKLSTPAPSGSDNEYVYVIGSMNSNQHPRRKVTINEHSVELLIDSGSNVNILDRSTFDRICGDLPVEPVRKDIRAYASNEPLPIVGRVTTKVTARSNTTFAQFYVVDGKHGCILGYETSTELGLLHVANAVTKEDHTNVESQHPELFEGLGKLKESCIKLHIDPDVIPVAQNHRRIPFHMRRKVEDELVRLEDLDIIEKVDGPTPWVSPIVVVPKPKSPNEVRICVDMRIPNTAIQRERHITPTLDDILCDLNGATVFSKLDLNNGYHQLELHEESRYITTFSTHCGLRRYKRLNFGINSAAEIFQNAIRNCIHDIPGSINVSDDILIFGRNQETHDASLSAVLERLKEKGLTLNKNKCAFNKGTLEFFGQIFSAKGTSPDPKKVQDIKLADQPQNPKEVRSLLGLANYCSRYIPGLASITQRLRDLTKTDHEWDWKPTHTDALNQLKDALSEDAVNAYFDIDKDTELIVDASPVGLGAILTQHDKHGRSKVIAYASRALTDVESRYSQTEREALAVTWGCLHFHLYIYGRPFTVTTDHQALVSIFGNPKSKPPLRIERWVLKLQQYEFRIVYKPGQNNPADYMSRHPTSGSQMSTRESKMADEYVNFIITNAIPKAITLEEVEKATLEDTTLQRVMKLTRDGRWPNMQKSDDSSFRSFFNIRNELTIAPNEKVLMRGTRIVMPTILQDRAVNLAHEGHQGITKTKSLLREKVWFPGIDKMTEAAIKRCVPCQAAIPQTTYEPLKMTPLPETPWCELSTDFYGPLPSGEYLLVIIDDYSRFPVVELVRSTSANTVIPVLDKVLSTFGTPDILKSDNGAPFNSGQFHSYAENMGFKHRKVTPYWPRANGEAERFMKNLGKVMKTSTSEGKPWKQELNKFLRNYRATPHISTNIAPSTALFGRNLKIKLPAVSVSKNDDQLMRSADTKSKEKMKVYADNRNHAKSCTYAKGDTVLVKQPRWNKLTPAYNPKPYRITRKKGSMITASRQDHTIVRNSSFFKKIPDRPANDRDIDRDASDYDADEYPCEHHQPVQPDPPDAELPVRPSRECRRPRYLNDYAT